MARISFETAMANAPENNNTNSNGVSFFSLADDGDEAIVRIMHDSTADFDILTTHNIKLNDKFRKVSCIRDPHDPVDNCPLCSSGAPIQQRFFIHMIQYSNVDGQITAKPVVWERSAGEYGTKLKTLLEEYGPLSDSVFKIRRNGKKGDMSTTYEIMYGNPNIYRADLYVKKPELFDNYNALGTVVLDKSYDEISQFVATGTFPEVAKQVTSNNTQQVPPTNTNYANTAPANNYVAPAPVAEAAPQPAQRMPWEAPSNNAPSRPTRYY